MNNSNDFLDKKLQMYIAKIAVGHLPFGGSVWNSSAKKLENILKERGIKLSQKLYYEYNLPDNLKPSEFMNKLIMEGFINDFYSGFAGKILKDKNLTMFDKAKIFKYVWRNRGKYKDALKQYEIYIRKNNPELANIRVDNVRSLVYGALFGFAPAEIVYFSDVKNRNLLKEHEILNLFKNRFGINVSYVLAPQTAKKVIAALEQNSRYNPKER